MEGGLDDALGNAFLGVKIKVNLDRQEKSFVNIQSANLTVHDRCNFAVDIVVFG